MYWRTFKTVFLSVKTWLTNFMFCWRCIPYNLFQMKSTRSTLLLGTFISTSLRVSGNYVPIIRRTYCICATLVFSTLYVWLSGLHCFLVYLFQLLYMFPATMCRSSGELTVSSQPADQTATHTEWKIRVSHRYRKFSWWWEHSCPKHLEKLK
jgi:hypothetical protein